MTNYYAVYVDGAPLDVVNRVRDARLKANGTPGGRFEKVSWYKARQLRIQIKSVNEVRDRGKDISKVVEK